MAISEPILISIILIEKDTGFHSCVWRINICGDVSSTKMSRVCFLVAFSMLLNSLCIVEEIWSKIQY